MGYIFAILAALFRWFVYSIDQKILEKISPIHLMWYYAVFTSCILGFVFFFKGESTLTPLQKNTNLFIPIMISFFLSLFATYCIYIAIQKLGAPRAVIFEISYPFFVILISYFLFKTGNINIYFIIGSLFLFAGSYIIIRYS